MADEKGTRSNPPSEGDGEKKMKQRGSPLFPSDGVITLRVEGNPKRKGSKAYDRWNYVNGMTVAQALEKGTRYDDLKWDSVHGFIAVNETPEMRKQYEAEAAAKAEVKKQKETAAAEKKAAAAAKKKAAADAKAAAAAKKEEGSRAQA